VKNEDVLLRAKEEGNILNKIRRRKNNWIGHILRRNCLLKYIAKGKHKEKQKGREEVKRRRQLLNDLSPLKAELNPICYLLALLGAHHFLHVSRIRVISLTLRLTYLLTPWSRVLLEKLTSKLCS